MGSMFEVKTPVSLLQELYVKKGITPKYDLVQIEGAIHEPTFKYRVTVGDLVATGSGQSKKKAKHTAAMTILEKIRAAAATKAKDEAAKKLQGSNLSLECFSSPYDDGFDGNPIGRLQELCIAKRFSPPGYLIASEVGLPHDRIFNMVCIVDVYKETGSGKSKKLAKRQAAIKMIETIKDVPVEQPVIYDEDDEVANKIFDRHSKSHKLADSHLKISQFHRAMKNATGEMIESLQSLSIGDKKINYKELLKKVAGEQKLDLNYMEIEEKSFSGQYQSLLLMSAAPVAVCFGTGESVSGAEEAAALNALVYLKTMTKK
uniref:DsRNA binding protein 1 n=1 Tax=Artemia franciscana TaxID=6661 RepID=A0A1X9WEM5_ARTSF|nr:dsRNA binding protein 1 [Artemia franciscana]